MSWPSQIPVGGKIRIGVPANPLPQSVLHQLADQLSHVSGLVEAHLPMVEVAGGWRSLKTSWVAYAFRLFESVGRSSPSFTFVIFEISFQRAANST